MLRNEFKECGSSLKALEDKTGVGLGCGGCRVVLHSLFGEVPSDINRVNQAGKIGTSCMKPGTRTMKGFIIADDNLESIVSSCNGVAPQLGNCDSTARYEYALVNHRGEPVLHRRETVGTNETFVFNTANEKLERPFYGTFLLKNVTVRITGHHASTFTGIINVRRPRLTRMRLLGDQRLRCPLFVTKQTLASNNDIYLALMNPYPKNNPFTITVSEVDTREELSWKSSLGPLNSTWINASKFLFGPALEKNPKGRYCIRIETDSYEVQGSITVYFFFHNKKYNIWSCNHL